MNFGCRKWRWLLKHFHFIWKLFTFSRRIGWISNLILAWGLQPDAAMNFRDFIRLPHCYSVWAAPRSSFITTRFKQTFQVYFISKLTLQSTLGRCDINLAIKSKYWRKCGALWTSDNDLNNKNEGWCNSPSQRLCPAKNERLDGREPLHQKLSLTLWSVRFNGVFANFEAKLLSDRCSMSDDSCCCHIKKPNRH